MAGAGLLNKKRNAPVPLRSVLVEATVRGYTAGVVSTLQYENQEEEPIEAVFTFPLDASSTVVSFSATIQDRKIIGRVEEKQKAQETYDDAIASGQSAFLMESERKDVFTISVGNLPPKEKAAVTVAFVMELATEHDGSVRFNLPSVLTPRYSPTSGLLPEEATNPTAHVTYLPSHHVPYTFNFSMRIEADVKKVESTTHKLSVGQSTDEEGFSLTTVTLAEEHRFDKDLVLAILPCHPHQPHAVVEPGSGKESVPPFLTNPAITLNYFPDFSSAEAVSELIFVIDRSGSMSGAYIEAAKDTMMLFLKSIPDGCYFNIVGFGSSYKLLFKESAPYDQAHLDQASDHTRAIKADMGGTVLLQPLREIFKMPSINGLPKQVFVLTDGAVSNTNSVIQEVKKNSDKARCFAVGIGSGASTALVKGIADAGRGSSEFVQSGEKMQPKVMRMLKRALTPSLSDVHVKWSLPAGVEVIQTPSKVPPVFSGDRLVIYGLLSNVVASSPLTECQATLSGVCGGKPFQCSVPFSVSPSSRDSNMTIHQLTAKCVICDLQEDGLAVETQEILKGLVSQGAKKSPESKKELIVELSVVANVISQETAFVAVDESSTEPVQGSMQLRQVPVATASDRLESCCLSAGIGSVLTRGQNLYTPVGRSKVVAKSSKKKKAKGGFLSSLFSFGSKSGSKHSAPHLHKEIYGFRDSSAAANLDLEAEGAVSHCGTAVPQQLRMRQDCLAMDDQSDSEDDSKGSLPMVEGMTYSEEKEVEEESLEPIPAPKSKGKRSMPVLRKSAPDPRDMFSAIVSQQRASGAWQMNSTVAGLVNKAVTDLEAMSPLGQQSSELHSSIWATAVVVTWLKLKCTDMKDEWELLAFKAETWLQKQSLPEALTWDAVLTAARKLY